MFQKKKSWKCSFILDQFHKDTIMIKVSRFFYHQHQLFSYFPSLFQLRNASHVAIFLNQGEWFGDIDIQGMMLQGQEKSSSLYKWSHHIGIYVLRAISKLPLSTWFGSKRNTKYTDFGSSRDGIFFFYLSTNLLAGCHKKV